MTTLREAAKAVMEQLKGTWVSESDPVAQDLKAALAEPERNPLDEDQMNEAYRYIWRNLPDGFDHTASGWIEIAIRYAERAHGIISTEVNGDKS